MAEAIYCTLSVTRTEEMCTACWRCAIVRVTIHILRASGVSDRTNEFCAGCREDERRGIR
jgi:hypothetical protein